MNHQLIGARIFDGSFAEQHERRAAESNGNFRDTPAEPLAGAQIKRNISPAPVIDFQFERDEGFRVGIGRDIRFDAVRWDRLAVHRAFAILSAHHVLQNFFRSGHLDGVQNFGLLVAYRVGFEGNGRLHGGERQQLKKMVGHHVAQRARSFIERSAMFDADGFRGGNLHVIDDRCGSRAAR